MDAFLLFGKRDIRYSELPYPDAGPGEVIVRVKSVGICGSDVHYFKDGKIGSFIPKAPFALGHELSGIIEEETNLFPKLKKGTRVSINPSRPCKTCSYCQQGQYNLCPSMKYLGSASVFPHLNGGFSEFICIPAENCFVLPEYVDFDEAALLEPLSVVLHALSKAGDLKDKSVIITGGGTIGQLTQMACRYYGAKTFITDIRPSSLEMAKKLGAYAALNPRDLNFQQQILAMEPDGIDLLIEASGAPGVLGDSIGCMTKGARIIQLGNCHEGDSFPYAEFMKKELSFQTSFRFSTEYELAYEILLSRKMDLKPIITDRYLFKDIPKAIQKASDSVEDIKIIIEN